METSDNFEHEVKANETGSSHKAVSRYNDELPGKVLLVEDDRAHVQLITRSLSGLMLDVVSVDSVSGAVDYLDHNPVDFVLTDLNLVTSSGFELIGQLEKAFPLLPVVVLTSSSNIDDAVRAMREGAWDYVSKHFSSNFSEHLELVVRRTWARALQKVREEEARTERDAFWLAACLAEDGLAIIDTNGSILFRNSSFERFLQILSNGLSEEESKITDLVGLVARFDFDLSQQLFSQIHINDDSLWRSELEIKINDINEEIKGSYYYDLRLSTVIPQQKNNPNNYDHQYVQADTNQLRYHLLWIRDTTQVKRSKELERNILATTTHDLKGPLGAIITSTEMILEDHQEDFVSELVLRIASCARTSISLVDQLLSARRLQDGLMKINPEWRDLKMIAEEVYQELRPVATSKNLSFLFVKPDSSVPLFADELAVKRIIGNLLGNALKFTPSFGEVILEIESRRDSVILRVSDNGEGIDVEKQLTLFDMFGRLPQHSNIEGSGLGLYITRQLVDMHKGSIELKSNPGQGSVFTVRFKNPETDLVEQ
ncbi:MAG TPA: hybrid sensor histidine kinase/response regulator [Oligoflexia bacterium]|nr:hybrid sensor histidine kinase/response regulator [Oligoflexia bacterium]HMP49008.1 hybrid sensor histidine kinase/response regulator [Oligoflexia bacterium]